MSAVLFYGLLVGLDNLQVASGLGMLPMRRRRLWAFALMFGLFEALMPLIGLVLGEALRGWVGETSEYIGPGVLAICGLLVIGFTLSERDADEVSESPWLLLVLPLSLSFDNLFAGVGLGALGFPVVATALTIGLVSALMCTVGLFFGAKLREVLPGRVELLGGVYLVGIAVLSLFIDVG